MSSQEQNLKNLGLTMLFGSIYDWVVAALTLLFPNFVTLFGVPYPKDLMYFRFGGLLMLVLPFFYLLGYIQTKRNIAVVPSAIIVRGIGFLFLTLHSLLLEESPFWALFGFADLLFGALHYCFLKRSGYTFRNALLGKSEKDVF